MELNDNEKHYIYFALKYVLEKWETFFVSVKAFRKAIVDTVKLSESKDDAETLMIKSHNTIKKTYEDILEKFSDK